MRAGGAGIPAFFTKTGVGTLVAEGKELREFDGHTYVMERSLVADVALVKADVADRSGNLRFNLTARNFNPACAMSGKVCIVEVERIVANGELAPDDIHLPGIYVQRVLPLTPEQVADKRIERRTVTAAQAIGDKWLITAGLKAGDRLIVEGTDKVQPDDKVKPVAVAAKK